MFKHIHPYPAYIPQGATKLIVGTLPPPRFSTDEMKKGDIDFNYGSRDGQLWVILDKIFKANFHFESTPRAIEERKAFLHQYKIGICDMVAVAYREKVDASDIGIKDYQLRELVSLLREHPTLKRILFTGGNSKNGPEYFFRQHIKPYGLTMNLIDKGPPRLHTFLLDDRVIETVSLTAPSGAANRAVGSMALYKKLKDKDPNFNTIDFRVLQYAPFFKDIKFEEVIKNRQAQYFNSAYT